MGQGKAVRVRGPVIATSIVHVLGAGAATDLIESLATVRDALDRSAFQQAYVALDAHAGRRIAERLGVRCDHVGRALIDDAFAAPALVRWLSNHPCDLLHAWSPSAARVAALAQPGGRVRPVVLSIHEPGDASLTDGQAAAFRDGFPAAIICPSPYIQRRIAAAGADPQRCHVVPPVAAIAETTVNSAELRIVSPGLYEDHRGHINAIWAMALLRELYGQGHIIIRADYDVVCREARFARSLPHPEMVRFAGAGARLPDLLPGAAAAVLAVDRPICPTPAAWAMAAGVPVVATAAAGLGDWIVHERTGLVVERPNPRLLAAAVMRLRQEVGLRRSITAQAMDFARTHFLSDGHARRLAAVYDSVLPSASYTTVR